MAEKICSSTSGFYRYTDIVYHYHRSIEAPDEASALKLFLHYNALGDAGHPLRVDKEKGIEMYIGTWLNGQTRLMFSSAQVEYMRYVLHAQSLTKELLPLPASEYLLTRSVLADVSTIYLKTPAEVKKAKTNIREIGNKLKHDSALASYRKSFETVRDLYASKKGTWLAIDIEAWTVVRSSVTEFGWSYVRWDGEEEVQDAGHFVVKKNKSLRNGRYVTDAQDKYAYGTSLELDTADFRKRISDLVTELLKLGPLFLVFHDCRQDIEFLKFTEYFPDGLTDNLLLSVPDEVPDQGMFVIDTTELFGALEGDPRQKRSLGDMCKLLRIETQYLHNAGNDAHYTLQALKSMASGNQLDAQREKRWPNQTFTTPETGPTLRVVHIPVDEDSDHSEPEE